MQALIAALLTPQGGVLLLAFIILYGITRTTRKTVQKTEVKTDDLVTMIETRDALNRKIDAATKGLGFWATRRLNKKLKARGVWT